MNNEITNSELNCLIPPEIKNDEFYATLQRITREEDIKTVLEIGSSSGEGSTEAFVTGIRHNPHKPILFCMEVSKTRFTELKKRYENDDFVKIYNLSSVPLENFPSENEVIEFYNNTESNLKFYPLERVLYWLQQDIDYVKKSGLSEHGIRKIKQENDIVFFDLVLIDGSEFTSSAELDEIYGAKYICLDDINTFKNYRNHYKLISDKNYTLIEQNNFIRNGYSIFKKNENIENCFSAYHITLPALPIHFFTIVLNGQPFIRYHIEIFKQLPFKWHWHIVEGVADLNHDTSWSVKLGGCISDEIHQNGHSCDGTTEYLDELAELYPDNITIYRQPEGVFWDGKREMVNAPLANIQEECLLWQIDVDELWTLDQICTGREIFISNPEKTAAFYWCWYFVGEQLIISTRNCYAQNPQQEWLRTWRYKPGAFWVAHEPPVLVETLPDGQYKNVATANPFLHDETEQHGLVFQHFAYVTPEQLRFKEQYYGYSNAVAQWNSLQKTNNFPVLLREYFSWVRDETQVDIAHTRRIIPIAQRESSSNIWRFLQLDEVQQEITQINKVSPIIIVDGVFFQLYKTGIARVWKSLLEEWANNGFAKHIILLDRAGTAPKIYGIRYRTVPAYDYDNTDVDREILQQVCDEESADIFISTYYTTPITTPSVFMAYDMIPEVMGWDMNHPMWREKQQGIRHASAYITISEHTAYDLVNCYNDVAREAVTVAYCGVKNTFLPSKPEEINSFRTKYGISKPYFMVVGGGIGYKNSILFFQAFYQLASSNGFDIVCTGSDGVLAPEFRALTSGSVVHMLQLSDEELAIAYSGAVTFVYPSKYEGFGLPVLEAMACGCPVITCPNASLPEVAGEAAIYIKDDDVQALVDALCEVQKPSVRQSLIAAGLEQAKKFSWSKMANIVTSVLIDATFTSLRLKDTNFIIFPDWSQSEKLLSLELELVIKAIAFSPDSEQITLLIYTSNISHEDAQLFLSGVTMNLLMQTDADIYERLEISLVGYFSEIQWQALLPRIKARIILEQENKQAIVELKAEKLISYSTNIFIEKLQNNLLSEDSYNCQLEAENHLESSQEAISQLHTQALALYHNRQLDEAEEKFKEVLQWDNHHAAAWLNIGTLYYIRERYQEALYALNNCLKIEPSGAIQHYSLGLVLEKIDDIPQAIQAYQQAIFLDSKLIDAYNKLGNIFLTMGKLEEAESIYRQAIAANPGHFGSHINLGNVILEKQQVDDAIAAYEKALELKPRNPDILYNLGVAFEAKNDKAEAALNYGYAFYRQGKSQEAVEKFLEFLETKTGDVFLYLALGDCYKRLQKDEEAIKTYQAGIKLYPESAILYFELSITLQVFGRPQEAIAVAEQASQLLPHVLSLKIQQQCTLPILYETEAEIDYYRQRFTQGLEQLIQQTYLESIEDKSNVLSAIACRTNFYLQYQGKDDLSLQKKYGHFVHKVMAANYPEWVKPISMPPVSNNGKIRIGYVSECMRMHTVGRLMLGWLRNRNHQDFEVYCYHIDPIVDSITQQYRLYSDYFRHIPQDLESVCKNIISDQLHILVILDIGMQPQLSQIAGLRLAPIQCTSWGHPITSGSPTIDYFLTSDLMEPENSQAHYSEKLVRLPNIGISYAQPIIPELEKSRIDFGLTEESILYLSCQSLYKYLPQYDYIFAAIAQKVPQAQFAFLSHQSVYITDKFRRRLQYAFANFGLNSEEYCVILPRLKWLEYLNLNCISDIFLDTFSWSGGNTALEAIACKLPIVTCPGKFMRGRHSYGILQMLGVTDTIAKNEDEYIEIAVKLGLETEWRKSIVEQMVTRHSYLYNDKTCVEALEDFYRRVVQEGLKVP